ncbi:hypothetical protein D3C71_512260 [compost metagenome]
MKKQTKLPAAEVIKLFDLQPNTEEGGYFVSTYPLEGIVNPQCSAIYYFLDENSPRSLMHKVGSDMLYNFYDGEPVEVLLLYPKGRIQESEVFIFSNDLAEGGQPMKVIPAGTWMGSRVKGRGSWSLMGVIMSPAFNPNEYFIGKRDELIAEYPDRKKLITALTN